MLSVVSFARVGCDLEEGNSEFLVGLIMYLTEYQENEKLSNNCFVELV